MMDKLLFTYNFNWADEIGFNCYSIVDKDTWDETVDLVRLWFNETSEPIEIFIGTNEEIQIKSYDEFLYMFESKEFGVDNQRIISLIEEKIGSHCGYDYCLINHIKESVYEVMFE